MEPEYDPQQFAQISPYPDNLQISDMGTLFYKNEKVVDCYEVNNFSYEQLMNPEKVGVIDAVNNQVNCVNMDEPDLMPTINGDDLINQEPDLLPTINGDLINHQTSFDEDHIEKVTKRTLKKSRKLKEEPERELKPLLRKFKKPKLHEVTEVKEDPEEEYKRLNAIKARENREAVKQKMIKLEEEVEDLNSKVKDLEHRHALDIKDIESLMKDKKILGLEMQLNEVQHEQELNIKTIEIVSLKAGFLKAKNE